jgi:hypothetical protein
MEEEAIVDKLVDSMERVTGALEHIGDMLDELNTNIGTLIDVEMRKGGSETDV